MPLIFLNNNREASTRYWTCTNMFMIVTFYAKFVNERSIVLLRLCSFYCMPVRSNDNSFSLEWISFCCLCWPSICFCCYGITMVAAIEATFFSAQVGMWEQTGVSRNNNREFKAATTAAVAQTPVGSKYLRQIYFRNIASCSHSVMLQKRHRNGLVGAPLK